jgi:hypothetical protein
MLNKELEIELSGRVLALHTQGPGFDPKHCKKMKKKKNIGRILARNGGACL